MKNKNIFTAIALIIIGALLLLKSLGIVHFTWCALFKLWPLLLIGIGIKFIPMSDHWKVIFKTLVLLLGVLLLFVYSNNSYCFFYKKFNCGDKFVITNSNMDDWESDTDNTESEETTDQIMSDNEDFICDEAKLNLSVSAGKLIFTPSEKALFSIEKDDFISAATKQSITDRKAKVSASLSPKENYPLKKSLEYNVLLSCKPIWEMNLELNATGNEIDLSAFKVKVLKIEANASAVDLKLGNLYDNVKINIASNASAIKLKLPKNMKCIIQKDNTLSSMNVTGFKKEAGGRYVSDDKIETVGTIYITVDANVSSVDVKRF